MTAFNFKAYTWSDKTIEITNGPIVFKFNSRAVYLDRGSNTLPKGDLFNAAQLLAAQVAASTPWSN